MYRFLTGSVSLENPDSPRVPWSIRLPTFGVDGVTFKEGTEESSIPEESPCPSGDKSIPVLKVTSSV